MARYAGSRLESASVSRLPWSLSWPDIAVTLSDSGAIPWPHRRGRTIYLLPSQSLWGVGLLTTPSSKGKCSYASSWERVEFVPVYASLILFSLYTDAEASEDWIIVNSELGMKGLWPGLRYYTCRWLDWGNPCNNWRLSVPRTGFEPESYAVTPRHVTAWIILLGAVR
jgi:hypothetical protein